MKCPSCEKEIGKASFCLCGWYKPESQTDPNHHRCSWVDKKTNQRCLNYGTISPFAYGDKPNWYCSWHYEFLGSSNPDYSIIDYTAWSSNRSKKQPVSSDWDENDLNQIKGLTLFAGKISEKLLKTIPKVMLDKAKQINYKPANELVGETFDKYKARLISEFNKNNTKQ